MSFVLHFLLSFYLNRRESFFLNIIFFIHLILVKERKKKKRKQRKQKRGRAA